MSIGFDTNYMKIKSVSPLKHKYLQIIDTIANKPERLYFRGELPNERVVSVAIVGSRKPTPYGREVTYQLSYDLAHFGVVIISGLALGIDGIAHRGALDAGGRTLAVMANSVETVYPATHQGLADEIIARHGALLSEYGPGVRARDFQFLARNRIVSGLADAVIVTEATTRSGTMSTVASALEQGREVFVVPGNITSPLSAGCNALIKQGAQPITCAEDVLEVLAPNMLRPQQSLTLGNTPTETQIIELIKSGIRNGDELLTLSGLSASEFAQTLTIMEIAGIIRALGGNQWTLR